jgi:hypothetical protein
MEVKFLNARDNSELTSIQVAPNTAIIGLNITNAGTLTKDGFPQFRFYPTLKTVTFGVQRLHKPEERSSLLPIAGQVLSFVTHNPSWDPIVLYRPIYDITPDDSLAAVLLESETRGALLLSGTKLSALIGELSEWVADKYTFAKQPRPRLLNRFLNEFPFPFKDLPGQPRTNSCFEYLANQVAFWHENIETVEPVERVYPNLKYDVIFHNELSALILVETDRYGSDDLIAQMYFQTNPKTVRIVLTRKVYSSVKHYVSIVNSNLYTEQLDSYAYPNVKELNAQERKMDGDPSWKNLKVQTIGPKKGTSLSFETIWNAVKLGDDIPH